MMTNNLDLISEREFYAVAYRDIKQDGYDNRYELIVANVDNKVIKEQIIEGAFGYPDMYIRHLSLTLANKKRVPIISYTDYELTPAKGLEIMAGALALVTSEGVA